MRIQKILVFMMQGQEAINRGRAFLFYFIISGEYLSLLLETAKRR